MADAWRGGLIRDTSTYAVVVVFKDDALPPLTYSGGFVRDYNGSIVVTSPGSS